MKGESTLRTLTEVRGKRRITWVCDSAHHDEQGDALGTFCCEIVQTEPVEMES